MHKVSSTASQTNYKRIITDISSGNENTLFVCIGGLHGNEQAGYKALEYLAEHLDERLLNGRFIALGGNLQALAQQKRYLKYDLNRIFSQEIIDSIDDSNQTAEYQELKEITDYIKTIPHQNYQRKVLIDLHTTSAPNGAFVVRTQTTDDELAKVLEIPVIGGLDNKLAHTAMSFMEKWGYETFAFEGGTIGEENSRNNLITGVWRLMQTLQMTTQPIHNLEHSLGTTIKNGISQYLECTYIHRIDEPNKFEMIKGFENFDPIEKGQLLAHQDWQEIRSPQSGYILMPLYQKEGQDGFFIVE